MRAPAHMLPRFAGKLFLPITLLVGLYLTFASPAGGGLAGGLIGAVGIALHALLFGPAATQRAAPPYALKSAAAFGLLTIAAAAFAEWRGLAPAPAWSEAGLFLASGASLALAFVALAGRAHALRDEDW